MFSENDGSVEKLGTIIGAVISVGTYSLLAWTALRDFLYYESLSADVRLSCLHCPHVKLFCRLRRRLNLRPVFLASRARALRSASRLLMRGLPYGAADAFDQRLSLATAHR
jgi:hypothetical protein